MSSSRQARPARRSAPPPEPRKRRTAVEARSAILDAAERHLVASGPAGIRLQEVAADVGISHPAVLHHFGSREALVKEVCERRYASLHRDIVAALESSPGGAEPLSAVLESVYDVLVAQGHGRATFWLALEGLLAKGDQPHIREISLAVHALRVRLNPSQAPPPLEDSQHIVVLAAFALYAQAVLGDKMLYDVGLGSGDAVGARFRVWLAQLITEHLGTNASKNGSRKKA